MADDLKRVGLVFKEDGSTDFKRSLSDVNNALADNRSNFKLTQMEWDKNTTASQKLAAEHEFLATQLDNSSMRVAALKEKLNDLESAQKPNQVAINKTRTELLNAEVATLKYSKSLEEVNKSIKSGTADLEELAKKLDKIGEKSVKVGKTMTKDVTAPILAVSAAAIVSFAKVDEAYDSIITRTGATSEEIDSLQGSFDNVFGNFPFDAMQVSDSIGTINQRFGLIGADLDTASVKFLKFAEINKIDVASSVELAQKALSSSNEPLTKYGDLLDLTTLASQKTGVSVDKLLESYVQNGAQLRALGFDMNTSIAFLGQIEKSGMNVEVVFAGLKKANANWAKSGKDANVEFAKTLQAIQDAPTKAKAAEIAIASFGAKAGIELADNIKSGKLSITEMEESLKSYGYTVDSTFDKTQDPLDQSKIAYNSLTLTMSKLGEVIQNALGPIFASLAIWLQGVASGFEKLPAPIQNAILIVGVIVAALGPLIILFGMMATGVSSIITLFTTLGPILAPIGTAIGGVAIGTMAIVAAVIAVIAVIAIFGDQIKKVVTDVSTFVNSIFNSLKNFFSNGILAGFTGWVIFFQDMFNSIVSILTGIIDVIRGVFTGDWKRAWNGVVDIFKGIMGGIAGVVKLPFNLIIGGLNALINGINWVIDGLNKIKFSIPSWVPLIGGKSFGINIGKMGNIAYLANGGDLLSGMAMVAEAGPELLLQQGNSTKVVPLTNSSKTNVDIIDYSQMEKAVRRALNGSRIEFDAAGMAKLMIKEFGK